MSTSDSDNTGSDDPDPGKVKRGKNSSSSLKKRATSEKSNNKKHARSRKGSRHGSKVSTSPRSTSDEPLQGSLKRKCRSCPRRAMSEEDFEFIQQEATLARSVCKQQSGCVIQDATQLVKQLMRMFDEESKSFQKPNVLVTGITGSGKSTLINSMFGKQLAVTGTGVPITQHFTKYDSPDTQTVIYDSKGLEHGLYEEFIDTTLDFFQDHKTDKLQDQIHVVWYIVNTAHARFEPFEQELCKKLFSDYPIFFLLNKADISSDEDRNEIRRLIADMGLKNCCGILDIVASPSPKLCSFELCPNCSSEDIIERRKLATMLCNDCGYTTSLIIDNGLEPVVKGSLEVLPDVMKESFVASQHVSSRTKEEMSCKTIQDFWENVNNSRSDKELLNVIAKMMAKLSHVWQFEGHSNELGKLLANDLIVSLKWKRKGNLLGMQKKIVLSESQKLHVTSLGILWNMCLRNLSEKLVVMCVSKSHSDDEEAGEELDKACSSLFTTEFDAMNAFNLHLIEEELASSSVAEVLRNPLLCKVC